MKVKLLRMVLFTVIVLARPAAIGIAILLINTSARAQASMMAYAYNEIGGRIELYSSSPPKSAKCTGLVAKEWGDKTPDRYGCWNMGPTKDVILIHWSDDRTDRTYYLHRFEFTSYVLKRAH